MGPGGFAYTSGACRTDAGPGPSAQERRCSADSAGSQVGGYPVSPGAVCQMPVSCTGCV
jgi:hypothetical protein